MTEVINLLFVLLCVVGGLLAAGVCYSIAGRDDDGTDI